MAGEWWPAEGWVQRVDCRRRVPACWLCALCPLPHLPAGPLTRPPARLPVRPPSDCGVFTCMCADFASQRLPLRYTQDDMENARLRIGMSILRGQVLG